MSTDASRLDAGLALSRHAADLLDAARHLVNDDADELEVARGVVQAAAQIHAAGTALVRVYAEREAR